MVWNSLPKGQGFLGTNMNPGHVKRFTYFIMDLSRQEIQKGVKTSAMLLFQACSIFWTSQKGSLNNGGSLLV